MRARLVPWLQRDLLAVGVWATSLTVTWIVMLVVAFTQGDGVSLDAWAALWGRWDFIHFEDIARLGYVPEPGTARTAAPLTAFLPAFPSLLAAGHVFGIPSTATGLVVSAVAGAVATVFIARLGEERRPGAGWAVAAVFVFSPTAIFLFAPYTEALFLAFAIPAWYYADKGRWCAAALLATGAGLTRISGVFLVMALFVLWLSRFVRRSERSARGAVEVLWLAVPTIAVLGWMAVLYAMTGRPLEYLSAQEYWGRSFTDPITAVVATWTAYAPTLNPWMRGAEIVAFLIGLITTITLLVRRRFGEGTWVGLNVAALGTSTYLYSVPRSSLLWWPLWVAIGATLIARRRLLAAYLVASATIMVIWDVTFFTGLWAG